MVIEKQYTFNYFSEQKFLFRKELLAWVSHSIVVDPSLVHQRALPPYPCFSSRLMFGNSPENVGCPRDRTHQECPRTAWARHSLRHPPVLGR